MIIGMTGRDGGGPEIVELGSVPGFGRAQFDLGQATMAMLLAAADLGIGSCHAGVADLRLARELLGCAAAGSSTPSRASR